LWSFLFSSLNSIIKLSVNKRGDLMGFYYFIVLFIGVFLLVRAGLQAFKLGSIIKTKVILLAVMGVMLIGLSIFLFSPGSSDVIAALLNWPE
jgi:hypothetical protein